jgi:hypothetical protein
VISCALRLLSIEQSISYEALKDTAEVRDPDTWQAWE